MNHVPHRQLDNFAASRAWNVPHRDYACGNMARGGVSANLPSDPSPKIVVQHHARRQTNKENHALIVVPALPYRKTLDHFRNALHRSVQFSGAYPDASRIERRIRAAGDDKSLVTRRLNPVAVMPNSRKPREVGSLVLLALWIVPETDQHRRERRRAHEFSRLLRHSATGRIEHP